MIPTKTPFSGQDRLRSLLVDNPTLLGVMSRFGLSFGFGDKSVRDVCRDDDVDLDSFLAVANFLSNRPYTQHPVSLPSLMEYLRKAHNHFLNYLLPNIRRKLIEAINCSGVSDVSFLLLKFFDEYVEEVNNHMHDENDRVFKYVSGLLQGEVDESFRITDYSKNHVSMTDKLEELKDVFIRHYHVKDNEILTSALLDIIYCGEELNRHCSIENRLFIPTVEKLEKACKLQARSAEEEKKEVAEVSTLNCVTEREKEIIKCVAKGMSNKEIADFLNLSIHTVTTYRRNISSKLQIHSAAGLTIFAILHNLIPIEELRISK